MRSTGNFIRILKKDKNRLFNHVSYQFVMYVYLYSLQCSWRIILNVNRSSGTVVKQILRTYLIKLFRMQLIADIYVLLCQNISQNARMPVINSLQLLTFGVIQEMQSWCVTNDFLINDQISKFSLLVILIFRKQK